MEIILYRDRRNHPLHTVRPALTGVQAQEWLSQALNSNKPFMAARFGNTELQAMVHFHKMANLGMVRRLLDPIETWRWSFSWSKLPLLDLENHSGFFPQDETLIRKFCDLMHDSLAEVDLLASWAKGEIWFEDKLAHAELCKIGDLESFRYERPWSRSLEGRDVLVIHHFAQTIASQYNSRRQELFANPEVLPKFNLFTQKSVFALKGHRPPGFATWFDALDHMTEQALACPADVVILGCAAYGFPLAARLKKAGKQCIHMGGATQLLFGIRGARWERPPHAETTQRYFNEFWVRPADGERPPNANTIEDGCYW
jgi:hypothetical protein